MRNVAIADPEGDYPNGPRPRLEITWLQNLSKSDLQRGLRFVRNKRGYKTRKIIYRHQLKQLKKRKAPAAIAVLDILPSYSGVTCFTKKYASPRHFTPEQMSGLVDRVRGCWEKGGFAKPEVDTCNADQIKKSLADSRKMNKRKIRHIPNRVAFDDGQDTVCYDEDLRRFDLDDVLAHYCTKQNQNQVVEETVEAQVQTDPRTAIR